MIYKFSVWDFPQTFSFCEGMQCDHACWLPFAICISLWRTAVLGFKVILKEAEGEQLVKMGLLRVGYTLPLLLFPKQAAGKHQVSAGSLRACGAGKGQYVLNACCGDGNIIVLPSFVRKKTLPSALSWDLASLKYNGATDLLLSRSRSKGEVRVWASSKTKIDWNKEGHLDEEKKKELCKSNDIFDETKSILAESQVLDPGRRFESSSWICSTLNKTLTIHWERAHMCAWISSLAGHSFERLDFLSTSPSSSKC